MVTVQTSDCLTDSVSEERLQSKPKEGLSEPVYHGLSGYNEPKREQKDIVRECQPETEIQRHLQ